MTRRERLLEQYEDAWFALLAEDVMVQEGERLEALNRQLLADPAAAVPESLDRRCRRVMDRAAAGGKRRTALRRAGKALRMAAVIAAVIATLFTTAFAVSEEFREAALELARTVTGRYTQLDIRRAGETGGETAGEYFARVETGWLPEGFSYCGGEYDVWAEFENSRGQTVRVEVYPENGFPVDYDLTELRGYHYEGLFDSGRDQGRCFTKDGAVSLDILDSRNGTYLVVKTSGGLPVDTAKKILANLRRNPAAGYFEDAKIGWLPEGFTYQEGRYDWYAKFEDETGRWIWIYLYDGAGSLHIDTEGAELVEDVTINGNEGLCVVKNGYVHIVTTDLTKLLYIDVIASDQISVSTVNRVVENINILP